MRISRTPRKADKLGEQIELTDAERTALNIRAIAPCDLGKGERAERAIKTKREREKHRREFNRRAAGNPTSTVRYVGIHRMIGTVRGELGVVHGVLNVFCARGNAASSALLARQSLPNGG